MTDTITTEEAHTQLSIYHCILLSIMKETAENLNLSAPVKDWPLTWGKQATLLCLKTMSLSLEELIAILNLFSFDSFDIFSSFFF